MNLVHDKLRLYYLNVSVLSKLIEYGPSLVNRDRASSKRLLTASALWWDKLLSEAVSLLFIKGT